MRMGNLVQPHSRPGGRKRAGRPGDARRERS
jgi:hypothetical protein